MRYGTRLLLIAFCALQVEGSANQRCHYIKESANSCSASYTRITSAADCDEAALSLDLPASASVTLSNKNILPMGCYFMMSTNQLYFNPSGSDSTNDADRVSICASKACKSSVSSARSLSTKNNTGNSTNGTDNSSNFTEAPPSCPGQDLTLLLSPYSGSTAGAANDIGSCGTGKEVVFFKDVAPSHTFTIKQTYNNYDSKHEMRIGGSCPGSYSYACNDDPDYEPITFTNYESYTQRAYFIIDAYYWGEGDFTIEWTYGQACSSTPQCGSGKWCDGGNDGICVNETEYVLQPEALSCPMDAGISQISSREDCEAAATLLGYSWQTNAINYALFPPGCMVVLPTGSVTTYYVYFNDHASGAVHPSVAILCERSNPSPDPTPAPTPFPRRRRYISPRRRRSWVPRRRRATPAPTPSVVCDTLGSGKTKGWCKKNCRKLTKCHKLCGRKCNDGCNCNQAAPSPSPSMSPSPSVSPSPEPAEEECKNDNVWFFKDNKKKKRKCSYIEKETNKKKKKQYCNKKGKDKSGNKVKGNVACPVACGTCESDGDCEDDDSWHVKNKPNQDCDWVSGNSKNRCNKKNEDGTKAKDACPAACGTCSRRLTIV